MDYAAWLVAPRSQALGDAERERIEEIVDACRDPVAPGDMEPDEAFRALCEYTRGKFTYSTDGRGVVSALQTRELDCAAASDMVVGILLRLANRDYDVTRWFPVAHTGKRPVVTPRVMLPGVTINNNLSGGGGRMFFSGGHFIAMVADTQYDLITGCAGHRLEFIEATWVQQSQPQAFHCDVDGQARVITLQPARTSQGLSTFTLAPALA
ncbi:MAG: hypothetical protein JNL85_13415 [Rubrivivax sp.]|nr:hypothetical protein [Rubrivivax sp.]